MVDPPATRTSGGPREATGGSPRTPRRGLTRAALCRVCTRPPSNPRVPSAITCDTYWDSPNGAPVGSAAPCNSLQTLSAPAPKPIEARPVRIFPMPMHTSLGLPAGPGRWHGLSTRSGVIRSPSLRACWYFTRAGLQARKAWSAGSGPWWHPFPKRQTRREAGTERHGSSKDSRAAEGAKLSSAPGFSSAGAHRRAADAIGVSRSPWWRGRSRRCIGRASFGEESAAAQSGMRQDGDRFVRRRRACGIEPWRDTGRPPIAPCAA